MEYMAAILLCLTTEPISDDTCVLFENNEIFYTEEECWDAVYSAIETNEKYPLVDYDWKVFHSSCTAFTSI